MEQTQRTGRTHRGWKSLALLLGAALAFWALARWLRQPAAETPAMPQETAEEGDGAARETVLSPADLPREISAFVERHPEAADFAEGYPGTAAEAGEIDLTADYLPGEIPLLLQFDSRWGYALYSGTATADLLGLSGCGPTALSMAVVGLTGNTAWNPLAVAEYAADHDYWTENDGTKWLLISEGCRDMGLTAAEVPLDRDCMEAALDRGACIVCVVGPGDFTDKGHFLVLCGYDGEGFFIRDPASRENSEKIWSYDRLAPQINAMWALTAE